MISVCMTTYNGARYIRQQLDSILSQLSPDDEVVISDDGSDDDTVQIIESYSDPRITILHHNRYAKHHRYAPEHYYVSANFENALSHTKGDYIFFSDQDDVWLPGRVKRMMRELQHADIVISNRTNVDDKLNVTQERALPAGNYHRSKLRMLTTTGFTGCQMAITGKLRRFCLPFPPDTIVHDFWIARLAIMLNLKLTFVEEPLILYRVHGDNVSNTTDPSRNHNPLLFKVAYRLKLLRDLRRRARAISRAEAAGETQRNKDF